MVFLIAASRRRITTFSITARLRSPNALTNLPEIMPIPGVVEDEVAVLKLSIEAVSSVIHEAREGRRLIVALALGDLGRNVEEKRL